MSRIFITGVTGFVGRSLALHLREQGHGILGSSHDQSRLDVPEFDFLEIRHEIRFDEPIPSSAFDSCDTVIHCAYDVSSHTEDLNVEGTRRIFMRAEASGARRQVLISSHSARADALSEYGAVKFELERFFLNKGQTVVRPGLVAGRGGLFWKQVEKIRKLPVIPLPDGGSAPVPLISVRDLCAALQRIVEEGMQGAYNLFYARSPDMREFIRAVKEAAGQRFRPVNVPIGWLLALADLTARAGMKRPRALDRLRTMRLNRDNPVHHSDMMRFLPEEPDLRELIRSI